MDTEEAQEYIAEAIPETHPAALPTQGYAALAEDVEFKEETEDLTELENQAHAQRVLLSSDAMRYFIGKVASVEDRVSALDQVIAKARVTFPSEDGWVVINLVRMEQMINEVNTAQDEIIKDAPVDVRSHASETVSGSLAEAIATGNIVAAYEMISHRPMVALADATADLDALYRVRNGMEANVSDMLKTQTLNVSIEQLQDAINALTSALDGTYTDEESAVKMAIMKAVKALAR